MKVAQNRWSENIGWEKQFLEELAESAQLVLLCGSPSKLKDTKCIDEIKKAYPNACLLGCSTAREICGTQVSDESLVVTAVKFKSSHFKNTRICMNDVENSFHAGKRLAESLV